MNPSATQLWDYTARALHTSKYRKNYIQALLPYLGVDKNISIIDTAAGTGFPALDIWNAGYHRMTCVDGDEASIPILREQFQKNNAYPTITYATWQDINSVVRETYDRVLNLDASLAYMDSWNTCQNIDGLIWHERISLALGHFFQLLNHDGILMVAIPRNNIMSIHSDTCSIGMLKDGGRKVSVEWILELDWDRRTKHWTNKVTIDGDVHTVKVQSYLFTKEELSGVIESIGMSVVADLSPSDIYDDIIVAQKGSELLPDKVKNALDKVTTEYRETFEKLIEYDQQ